MKLQDFLTLGNSEKYTKVVESGDRDKKAWLAKGAEEELYSANE